MTKRKQKQSQDPKEDDQFNPDPETNQIDAPGSDQGDLFNQIEDDESFVDLTEELLSRERTSENYDPDNETDPEKVDDQESSSSDLPEREQTDQFKQEDDSEEEQSIIDRFGGSEGLADMIVEGIDLLAIEGLGAAYRAQKYKEYESGKIEKLKAKLGSNLGTQKIRESLGDEDLLMLRDMMDVAEYEKNLPMSREQKRDYKKIWRKKLDEWNISIDWGKYELLGSTAIIFGPKLVPLLKPAASKLFQGISGLFSRGKVKKMEVVENKQAA